MQIPNTPKWCLKPFYLEHNLQTEFSYNFYVGLWYINFVCSNSGFAKKIMWYITNTKTMHKHYDECANF